MACSKCAYLSSISLLTLIITLFYNNRKYMLDSYKCNKCKVVLLCLQLI